jgi:hypothetical protein
MPIALFLPHAVLSLRDFLPCARLLREHGWRVVVLDNSALGAEGTELAQQHGFEVRPLSQPGAPGKPVEPPKSSWRRRVKDLPVLGAPLVSAYILRGEIAAARARRAKAARIFDETRPDALVVFDDRSGGMGQAVIHEAKRRGLRIVVVPSEGMVDGTELNAAGRLFVGYTVASLSWTERLIGRLLVAAGIQNYATIEGTEVYWRVPSGVLAEWLVVDTPRRPFVRGSNQAVDVVAVASESYRDAVAAADVPAERIVVTGYPRHDEIAEGSRALPALQERLARTGAPVGRPIILIGLSTFTPVDPYATEEKQRLEDMVFVARSVRSRFPNHTILYTRHPRTTAERVREVAAPLFDIPDAYLAEGLSTYEAIVLSEIYVPYYSATTYGALAAGKLVLIYDFIRTVYQDIYIGWSKEALYARSREAFLDYLDRLTDPAFRAERMTICRANAASYGKVDGRVHERIAALVDPRLRLAETRQAAE